MALIIASLAEMSSMAPTSGGQYHWVSEFAPRKHQQFLSYLVGWLSVLSWQAATASGGTLTGGIIQGLIAINNPDYTSPLWHLCLLAIANVVLVNIFNVYGAKLLAPIQNGLMILHVFTLITIVVVLWVLAPHPSAADVFVNFENTGGYSSIGLALCVGQISALFGLMCNDAAAHMSEEVKDAGRTVPNSMFHGFLINAGLGLVLIVTYVFAIPNVQDAINDPSGFPFLYVFQQAMSVPGVNGITAVILFLLTVSNISFNASTARQTFAFARDNGLPFSAWIGKVSPEFEQHKITISN
jgi:amino acid transporter